MVASTFSVACKSDIDKAEILKKWKQIEEVSAGSFFQSSIWIDVWLKTLGDLTGCKYGPEIIEIVRDNNLVGIGLISSKKLIRNKIIKSDALFLNNSGNVEYDSITIEHNGLLIDRRYEREAVAEFIRYLSKDKQDWDEFYIDGISDQEQQSFIMQFASESKLKYKLRDVKNYYYVELLSADTEYLSLLSRNTRYQIKRAVREYEKIGKLSLIKAEDEVEAEEFFNRLTEIHQAYWVDKGKQGAFFYDFQMAFHRNLIRDYFNKGYVQLLKIQAGNEEVGYLYNFMYSNVVYSYQSGFIYKNEAKFKPGLVSHYLAIEYNARLGATRYDFLAGESQYKRSMSTQNMVMNWLILQRPKLGFFIEDVLRGIRAKLG